MKDRTKGLLALLLTIVVIAATAYVAVQGIGKTNTLSARRIKLGLDLAGGVSVTYEAVGDATDEQMKDALYKMQLRAQSYNTESAVYMEGDNRIDVDIPSVSNANEVLEELGSAGTIYFIYGQNNGGKANISYDSASGKYVLSRSMDDIIADGDVVLDGSDIDDAQANVQADSTTNAQESVVELTMNSSGASKFATATKYAYSQTYGSTGNQIAIVYDGQIVSAPCVEAEISDGKAVISGMDDFDEAKNIASTIRIGALPVELQEIRAQVVGAKLGANSISQSLLAGMVGLILVILLMLIVFRIAGLAADLALLIYVTVFVILLNGFNVTLTLSGIAGVLLSIGMAVDANVIISTRIQEEIATGKTVRSSIRIGFHKALSAIIDGNITTLIAAVVLYLRGSGSIKGFAITLGMGVILSMLTAIFVTRFILVALYNIGFDSEKFFGKKPAKKAWAFIEHWKWYAVISGVAILSGIVAMIVFSANGKRALNYGLDFTGGTSTEMVFSSSADIPANADLEKFVSDTLGKKAEIVQVPSDNASIIKTDELSLDEQQKLTDAIKTTYNIAEENITVTSISGTISNDMKSNALWAVIISTVLMLFYIWIRFKNIGFAVSSVIPLLHDVLVTLTVYAVCRISVGNNCIACMLTLVGYSINATIVVFDRIRENVKLISKKTDFKEVINLSITQTLSRNVYTSLTTLFMIFTLSIFGGSAIREFSIPLMVGLISGGYSSVCIAGCFLYLFSNKAKKTR